MDRAAVPIDSDLRKIENIFFPKDIREIPGSVPPEEPLSAPITAPNSFIFEVKGGNEEVQPPTKDKSPEDALTIRDVVVQVREAVSKPSAGGDHPEADLQRAQPKIKPRTLVWDFSHSSFLFSFVSLILPMFVRGYISKPNE